MSYNYSPKIITDGLVFAVDAKNPKSNFQRATGAADFPASTEHLTSSEVVFDKTNTAFTMGGWWKKDVAGAYAICGNWDAANGYMIQHSNNGNINIWHYGNGSNDNFSLIDNDNLDEWIFGVMVYDPTDTGQEVKGTINGSSFVTDSRSVDIGVGGDVRVGAYQGGGYMNGAIDNTFFYNRALSLSEIQEIGRAHV